MITPTKHEVKKFAALRGETAHYSGKLKKWFFRKFSDSPDKGTIHHKSYISKQDLTPRQEIVRKRKGK